MRPRYDDWLGRLKALGAAFLDVLKAEGDLWRAELWERSGKTLLLAVGLLAAAAAFLALGSLLLLAGFVLWLGTLVEPWLAALVTAALLLVATEICRRLGLYFLNRRFVNPATTTRARLDAHLRWWHEKLLHDDDRTLGQGDSE